MILLLSFNLRTMSLINKLLKQGYCTERIKSFNYEWFQLRICNGWCMPAENAYLSGHQVLSIFLGLACAPIVETRFLDIDLSLLDFSVWIPLGTFSILLMKFYGLFFSLIPFPSPVDTWRSFLTFLKCCYLFVKFSCWRHTLHSDKSCRFHPSMIFYVIMLCLIYFSCWWLTLHFVIIWRFDHPCGFIWSHGCCGKWEGSPRRPDSPHQ